MTVDGPRGLGKDVGDRRTGEGAVLLHRGQRLYQQGSFKDAIEAFTEVLSTRVLERRQA